jgi:hypothetical protein
MTEGPEIVRWDDARRFRHDFQGPCFLPFSFPFLSLSFCGDPRSDTYLCDFVVETERDACFVKRISPAVVAVSWSRQQKNTRKNFEVSRCVVERQRQLSSNTSYFYNVFFFFSSNLKGGLLNSSVRTSKMFLFGCVHVERYNEMATTTINNAIVITAHHLALPPPLLPCLP